MTDRISGYDPASGICWQFNNKGDGDLPRCKCPAHSRRYGERTLAFFGRCRSGSRWFWRAHTFGREHEACGWEDTEELATAAAMAAVCGFRDGLPILASFRQDSASYKLKELNKTKRAERPPSDTKDSRVVEYLYGYSHLSDDVSLYRFRITKKTARRVYYIRRGEWIDEHDEPQDLRGIRRTSDGDDIIGYVNRQRLEADGEVTNRGVHWCHADSLLYASLQLLLQQHQRFRPEANLHEAQSDLRTLKAEMAAAHPDRGGSSAAFIAARAAYTEARRRLRGKHAQ